MRTKRYSIIFTPKFILSLLCPLFLLVNVGYHSSSAASSSSILPLYTGFTGGIRGEETVWEAGPKGSVFTCPGDDDPCHTNNQAEFSISNPNDIDFPDFPCGMAVNHDCLPSEIRLNLLFTGNYSKPNLSILSLGKGVLSVSYDTNIILEYNLDSGFGWEVINNGIALPYIISGERCVSIELRNSAEGIVFKHLKLTAYPDTDKDGISDYDEGDMDCDDDGLPDYLDPDSVIIPCPEIEKSLLIMARAAQNAHSTAPLFQRVSKKDMKRVNNPQLPSEEAAGIRFIYGIISGEIVNQDASKNANLIISPYTLRAGPDESAPSLYGIEQVWAKAARGGDWIMLDSKIDTRMNQITITLEDAGAVDLDQKGDGILSFSIFIAVPATLPAYSIDSCFIVTIVNNRDLVSPPFYPLSLREKGRGLRFIIHKLF